MTSCNAYSGASVYHVAALLTGAAQLIFLYNLIHSRFWASWRER